MPLTQLTPAYSPNNVLTGQMALYTQVLTAGVTPALPPDTLATGSAWATPWVPVGATEAGSTLSVKRTTDSITVEEQITDVDQHTKSMTVSIDLELSEDTFQAMQLAFGGATVTATAAGASQVGKNTMVLNTALTYYVVGFESINQFGFWRRCVIPKCVSISNTKTAYQRSKKQRTYTVSINNLCPPEQILYSEMTAIATS